MRKLAIVILNWNGRDMLRKYLPSVIRNSVGDVVVADNSSTDDSVGMLMKYFPATRVILLERNYGFAGGYNLALEQLPGYEYYLLLNSDVEIRQPGWDKVLTDYMDAHPECAACQPKLLDLRRLELEEKTAGLGQLDAGKRQHAAAGDDLTAASEDLPAAGDDLPASTDRGNSSNRHRPVYFEYAGCAGGFIDKYGYPFCRGRIFDTVEEDRGQYDEPCTVMWATGAALLCRATDWRASGGLDTRFFAHMEEIDLCWRLRTMGRDIACVPQSTAYHLGGATLSQGNPRKTYLNFRNNLLMLYKNLPEAELSRTLRTRLVLDFVAALQFLLRGDLPNMKAVMRARSDFRRLKPAYAPTREAIQTMRTTGRTPEHTAFSILWEYYIRGRHTFDALPWNK